MGRYCTCEEDGDQYKFGFGSQSSEAILDWTSENERINSCAGEEDIPAIKERLLDLEADFKEKFDMPIEAFEKLLDEKYKGGMPSTDFDNLAEQMSAVHDYWLGKWVLEKVEKHGYAYFDSEI